MQRPEDRSRKAAAILNKERASTWLRGDAVDGASYRCGDLVLVRRGQLAGQVAVLVNLESLTPKPRYLAENGATLAVVSEDDIEAVAL